MMLDAIFAAATARRLSTLGPVILESRCDDTRHHVRKTERGYFAFTSISVTSVQIAFQHTLLSQLDATPMEMESRVYESF